MCGLAGLYQYEPGFLGSPSIEPDILREMADTLFHRGPDDDGYFVGEGIGLAFRRLSIVDVEGGQQPVFSGDGSIAVVCNGEIYNHEALRSFLQGQGKHFHSHCDIEILPHLYEIYGDDFVKYLQGQFAIALYDKKKHKLLLARDPVGIAPLYFTNIGGTIAFGSEIRALTLLKGFKKVVNLNALDQLLSFPGIVSPTTFFKGVSSLKPGHMLIAEQGKQNLHKYWDLEYPPTSQQEPLTSKNLTQCLDQLDVGLQNAVSRRLQGDVPIAAYLSGGLDSSLIAAIVSKVSPGKIKDSFSITFPSLNIDESQYQQVMAKHLGTNHHSFEVSNTHIADRLQEIVNRAETPLRESYNACSLILSGMVQQQGIKAVLSGEGADELFGGYVGYRMQTPRQASTDDLEEMLEQQMRQQLWGDSHFFYEKSYHAHREQKKYLYSEAVQKMHSSFDCLEMPLIDQKMIKGKHPLHQRSYVDFKLRMSDHLLADHGDRVAFAHSVECRYPFLDADVINLVRKTPPQWLLHDNKEKYLLKQLAERYLPKSIIQRQKFSFVAPSSSILLKNHQKELIGDILAPQLIKRQGYFDPDTVEYIRQQYLDPDHSLNQTFEDDLLMIVLTFGIWLDEFSMPNFS